jgi:hypothetical protein
MLCTWFEFTDHNCAGAATCAVDACDYENRGSFALLLDDAMFWPAQHAAAGQHHRHGAGKQWPLLPANERLLHIHNFNTFNLLYAVFFLANSS